MPPNRGCEVELGTATYIHTVYHQLTPRTFFFLRETLHERNTVYVAGWKCIHVNA